MFIRPELRRLSKRLRALALLAVALLASPAALRAAPAVSAVQGAQAAQVAPLTEAGHETQTPPRGPHAVSEPALQTLAELDGRWDMVLDPDNRGLSRGLPEGAGSGWSKAGKLLVPGVLEAGPASADYDGVAWYRTTLPAVPMPPPESGRLMLEFGAVNWRADAWLDGAHLGRHDGGDAPFRFDVSARLTRPGAVLVVRCVDPGTRPVDGLVLAGLPNAAESRDGNWGGITGSVRVRRVPLVELRRHDSQLLADGSALLRLDLHNHADAPRRVELALAAPAAALAWNHATELPPGETRVSVPLPAAEALPRWSPAQPVAHAAQLVVHDAGLDTHWELPLALRHFSAEGPHFTLNGERLPLRGVLYPPTYPRGMALPPDPGFLRRELVAIRAAGFNLVRVPARAQPDIYALCDELGLLVCAEPTLGAVTYELPETGPAAHAAVRALADAVAGHPSVVMVNLLDGLSGDLWRRTDELVATARERMPERLLIDDSGGRQGSARLWNPQASEPQPIDDVHLPREGVPSAALHARVADLGAGHERLVWVSSWGVSGTPDFRGHLQGFEGRLQSADARASARRLDEISAQFAPGSALVALASDLSNLAALGAAAQVQAVTELGRLLRDNPRIAGDCFSQWRDAGIAASAGLCSPWGRAKPVLRALATLNGAAPAGPASRAAGPPLDERPVHAIAAGSLVGLGPELEAAIAPLVDRRLEAFGTLPRLVVAGPRPAAWSASQVSITVALLRLVRDGGTLLWLHPPDAGRPLPQQFTAADGCGQVAELPFDIASRRTRGAGIETLLAFAPGSPLLADLSMTQLVPDERFLALRPERVLLAGPGVVADVQCGALAADGSYAGAAVQAITYGKGHLVLCTLPFTPETLADPFARRVLENVVRYAAGIASRKPPPPDVPDVTPPAASRDGIERTVWRAQIYFGLAERLAQQDFDGRPSLRDELPDHAAAVARKSVGLDRLVAGEAAAGLELLALLDQGALTAEREEFLRTEIRLADARQARDAHAVPLAPPERIAAELLHARALRMLRLEQAGGALEALAQAIALLAPPPGER